MVVPQTELIATCEGAEILRRVLTPGDYVIGRGADADLRVEAGQVSRRHAQLTVNYHEILIEDLGSANGTFVNGQPVTEAVRLWPGQRIEVGATTFILRRLKAADDPDQSLAPQTATVRRILPEELLRGRKYEIGGVVAQGGMGAILDAREATIERKVAMKVMLDAGSTDDLLRFIAEAKITGQLEHPSIVPIYELGVDEHEQVFYTMKFVRGITLRKVLDLLAAGQAATVRKFPLGHLLTVFQKVCDALAFAHAKGVIHRDLKPENIMLGDFGEVLVMDWGLAKVIGAPEGRRPVEPVALSPAARDGRDSATLAGSIMGTPQYMSPEQARGEIDVLDARTDIYALGAILYHILTLRPPVEGGSVEEVLTKVRTGLIEGPAKTATRVKPGAVSHLPGGHVPESLGAVAMKAMALDRDDRYATTGDLQADVAAYQSGFATSAEKAGAWKQFTLLIKRNKTLSIAIAAAVLLLIGVSAAFTTKVLGERNRAERALADLNKAAPTLAAQAESLVAQGQLDAGIEQLDFALAIAPHDAGYRLRRAHLLQASLRLKEAAAAYRGVLSLHMDESAKTNLALTEKLLAKWPATGQPSAQVLRELYDAIRAQGRIAESLPLGQRLGLGAQATEDAIRLAFRAWEKLPGWEKAQNHFSRETDGTFALHLDGLPIQDLSPLRALRDLPISAIGIVRTLTTDLAPLAVLPLRYIDLFDTPVTDLAGLRGLKLTGLNMQKTKVRSLEPLRGMPLVYLDASSCHELTDIEPLRGMALESLNLEYAVKITSIDVLRGMPLKTLSVGGVSINDIRPLRGMPLERAYISGSFQNIEPLKGAPLKSLSVSGGLTDLSALRGSPVEELGLQHCAGIKDFTPLLDCPRLNLLRISPGSSGVEKLRGHPTLKLLGFDGQSRPVAEFLDEWEAQHKPEAK